MKNCIARLTYAFIVWKEDASLPAMFSSTNQQLFQKELILITVATTADFRNKWKPSRAIDTFCGEQR